MQSNQSVELYHFPPSLCSQKVRLALHEKGVPWVSRLVNIGPPMENYEPAYARLNPRMVVPTLVVEGDVIVDSAHIVAEIDRRFDGPPLRADDPEVIKLVALQDNLDIREMAYARTSGVMGFLVKGSFDKRIRILTAQRDKNPDLAPLYQARIDDVLKWREISSTQDEVEVRRQGVRTALAEIEELAGGPAGLLGDYSLADVTWTVMIARLTFMGWRDEMGPRTRTWYARMKARPSFDGADIWERVKVLRMLPIVARVIGERLGLS